MIRASKCRSFVRMPLCEPVNEIASSPRDESAIVSSAIVMRSPTESSMSSSRRGGAVEPRGGTMKASLRTAALLAPVALALAAPGAAQVFGAAGFATISMAGLGNTTSVAGESRIPILARDVSYDSSAGTDAELHVRAIGHRGVVRQLDIEVRGPVTGRRYELGTTAGAALRVRLDQGAELAAQPGHGSITITAVDAQHVTGTYEGTFQHGSVPMVLRGHFEANLASARPAAGSTAAPGSTTAPGR